MRGAASIQGDHDETTGDLVQHDDAPSPAPGWSRPTGVAALSPQPQPCGAGLPYEVRHDPEFLGP